MRSLVAIAVALALAGLPSVAHADDVIPVPVARMMMGPAIHVEPNVVQFALDATAGVEFVFAGGHGVSGFELGYAYDHIGLHAFNLAGQIGLGSYLAFATYRPHLLLGTQNEVFAGGMRNALGGHFFLDLLDIEVGHQFIASGGVLTHSVNVMFGMNPAAFAYVLTRIGNYAN